MKIISLALVASFVALPALLPAQDSRPSSQPSSKMVSTPSSKIASTDGYPLSTCVVSGKSLAKKMKVIEVKGRTVKVCCGNCAKKVAKNPEPYLKKLDAAVIAQQTAHYPLSVCPISGKKLGAMGKGKNIVVDGQLVRLCCGGCVKKAQTTQKDYVLNKIKRAAYAQQIKGHEHGKGLTCVVSKKPADRKGTAQMIMHGNTLVAVCCKGCLKKFKADPNKYLSAMGGATSRPSTEHGDHAEGHDKCPDCDDSHDKCPDCDDGQATGHEAHEDHGEKAEGHHKQ